MDLVDELAAIVGSRHVLADPALTAAHRTDWTGRYGGAEAIVVRPGAPAEVADVVRLLADRRVPLVTQGGNTGLVGGSVPAVDGSVVVSTTRLVRADPVDAERGTVVVGAGVTPSALAAHLAGSGWRFAVDLGARDVATIGGMIATDAGGMRVFRFGTMRAQLAGTEVVGGDGGLTSRLAGLPKDATGFEVDHLLCGSEGTLGIVTAACLRLVPDPPARATALIAVADGAEARRVGHALRRTSATVEVVEYVSRPCVELVAGVTGAVLPFAPADVVLVEAAGDESVVDELAAAVEGLGSSGAPLAAAVATDATRRAALWRWRDDVTTSLATLGSVVKYDVSVPSRDADAFRSDADAAVAALAPGARPWWFGHVCDENLHLNVTGVPPDAETAAALDAAVLTSVAAHGGSISAEHGIGRAKARFLHLARSTVEIERMRAVKAVLDPAGVLNPGVLLPPR